jgi:asparagine synthase (glutamine-hydrolysing)
MCGITGFWHSQADAKSPLETLQRMSDSLAHRGPDDSGFFHEPSAKLGLAFRRLAIVDLSAGGHQPMYSASGRYVIVFNGEFYNFEEIRRELDPWPWRSHSDTEVMLEAIERWGLEAALDRFVGMFAFALWDRRDQKLHLVRDRVGIKPVYYGWVDGNFVFASELKAIQQHPGFTGEVDRDVLALYMRHNYVPSPYSIYKGLRKLPPGCLMTLTSATAAPVLTSYWSAREIARKGIEEPFNASENEAIAQLHDKLLEAVRLRMIADVPLGAFLSGGIDSSTVVALMQAQSTRPVKTFTIGFHEDSCNEAVHAKQVAERIGTDHTELYLTAQDALDVVPLLARMYDEPFSDSSQIPAYLVSRLARKSVTVSLSGDGGDELFGGYRRYMLTRSIWRTIKRLPRSARGPVAGLLRTTPPGGIDRLFHLLRPVIPNSIRQPGDKAHKLAAYLAADSREKLYLCALSHWEDPAAVVLNSREPNTVIQSISELTWLPSLDDVMMLADLMNYLPDDVLTNVDRASMAVGLEARVPLLDHRVVEFAWKLPQAYKIRGGTGKWILRQVLAKYIPQELIDWPKMGFTVPIAGWLRGPLREWAEDLLGESILVRHGLLESRAIREKWKEHLSGVRNWQHLLWGVLMFQDWFSKASLRTKIASCSTVGA